MWTRTTYANDVENFKSPAYACDSRNLFFVQYSTPACILFLDLSISRAVQPCSRLTVWAVSVSTESSTLHSVSLSLHMTMRIIIAKDHGKPDVRYQRFGFLKLRSVNMTRICDGIPSTTVIVSDSRVHPAIYELSSAGDRGFTPPTDSIFFVFDMLARIRHNTNKYR